MSENNEFEKNEETVEEVKEEVVASTPDGEEEYSLNDDRRVKSLSPGALVVKRFFRNKLAVLGLIMLAAMFIFSFIGGLISPYGEDEQFYTYEIQMKQYCAVTDNDTYRYVADEDDGYSFSSKAQTAFQSALMTGDTTFTVNDVEYVMTEEGEELYSFAVDGVTVAYASKDIVNVDSEYELDFQTKLNCLIAYVNGESSFETIYGDTFTIDEDGNVYSSDGDLAAFVSRLIISSSTSGRTFSTEFRDAIQEAIEADLDEFTFTDTDGTTYEYEIEYNASSQEWSINRGTPTYVYDSYASPSSEHWLGTDTNGMDVLTRLMYGGRVSLMIGFLVVIIEAALGVVLGGISGYFGGWVDNLIMRIVDVFYCIPSTPLIIILGSAMDAVNVDPQIRMIYLMLILGFLGWPSIARLVRGQILTLREQEFMMAAEATGLSVKRRIFKHLVPNVMPQLIVTCTMSLGSTILTEATLSFLGLGVKFPFASWGNIISDVNDSYVMTHYWFVWIPAGICLLIAVLGFNFVGDGLRDAFDPKMKR